MAWANSKIFYPYLVDVLNNTTALDLNTDTFKVPLYNNSATPDQTVTSANSAYGAGVWAANEVTDTPSWPAGGRPLASVTAQMASNVFTFDAADTVSADATTDLTNVYGSLVYSTIGSPVANQGVCFNYFGGPNTVTNGTFTVVWAAAGIMTITI